MFDQEPKDLLAEALKVSYRNESTEDVPDRMADLLRRIQQKQQEVRD